MSQKNSYQHASFFRGVSLIVGVLAMSLIISFTVLAVWTGPSVNPPDANAPTPLNVGNIGQSKLGGLILGTNCVDPCTVGLIVDKGNVGIGTTDPGTSKLKVTGTIESTSGGFKFPDGSVQDKAAIKVYKSDGSTLLGRFLGWRGSDTQNICSGLAYLNESETITQLNNKDCFSIHNVGTIVFSDTDCQGTAYVESGWTTADQILVTVSGLGRIYRMINSTPGTYMWRSYFGTTYSECRNSEWTSDSLYAYAYDAEAGRCGNGVCVIR